jgi:hypothetical protein
LLIFPAIPRNPAGILDTEYYYNAQQAYETIVKYSAAERIQYAVSALTADILYPIIYAMLLTSISLLLLKKLSIRNKMLIRSAYISYIAAFFDLLENGSLAVLMLNYPVKFNSIAAAAGLFTAAKWSFILIAILYILSLWSRLAYHRFSR